MSAPCLGCESDAQPVACGVATVNAFMSGMVLFALDPRQIALYIAGFCPEHAALAARVISVMAEKNKLGLPDLVAKLDAAYLAPMKKKVKDFSLRVLADLTRVRLVFDDTRRGSVKGKAL